MSAELFTITLNHVAVAAVIAVLSCVMLVPNKNGYYTYWDRATSWILGVLTGLTLGAMLL